MERVIVGVDGSEAAKDALRWALEEARRRDASLTVVLVVEPAHLHGHRMASFTERGDVLDEAQSELDRTVSEVVGGDTDPTVERRVESGDPRRTLQELSGEADLLVVGSRGHGELTGLLLGSVGQYLVTHARCPVTVVRPKGAPTDE